MQLRHIPFKKMNGLGNDFAIIDARAGDVRLSAAAASAIAHRSHGAGCDQVIVLEPSRAADIFMRILNADGSEVSACGNASRCVAALMHPELGRNRLTIETRAGVLSAEVAGSGLVTVDMGAPRLRWDEIPLSRPFEDTRAIDLTFPLPDGRLLEKPCVVNVGNPHCIFWVEDSGAYDLASFGGALENHLLFPERANISLAEIVESETPDRIKLRVWERGTGVTQACGTAACAAAVAAARTGRTGRAVSVELPGGVLFIEWRAADDHILMSGPAEFEFEGVLHFNGDGLLAGVARPS
jgi:diaminopimelate epimerase